MKDNFRGTKWGNSTANLRTFWTEETEETENAKFWSLAEDVDVDVDEDEDWVVLYGTGQLIPM